MADSALASLLLGIGNYADRAKAMLTGSGPIRTSTGITITPEDIQQGIDTGMAFSGGGLGIKAYHGSPHDFEKFDLSKIGTGEGAQAYGHGLYFAEAEPTAKAYRDTLQGKGFKIPEDVASLPAEQRSAILQAANAHGAQPDVMEAAKRAQWASPDLRSQPLEVIADKISRSRPPPGKMYEVNINADPAHFLDWDKPLSEQPAIVQNMARNADLSHLAPGNRTRRQIEMWREGTLPNKESEPTGNVLHNALTDYGMNAKDNAALTNQFQQAGIPGIKYLDQGSRSAGEGSRNYVVFDDKLIDIIKKYGITGALGSLLLNQQFGEPKT